ncbi:MAG: gliding motility lipoprotein GldH [bacterium]
MLFLLMVVMISCDSNRIFEEHVALEKGTWNVKNKLQYDVQISNLVNRYNMYLNVRNGPEYPYSNLFLFMNTVSPDGKISRDTVELTLADFDGRWLGSGMSSIKFSRFLFHTGIRFTQAGSYRFILEQAMRVNELKGIYDIGIRIEKQ